MSLSIRFHEAIEKHNVFRNPTEKIHDCFTRNPTLFKCALLVNHLFRTIAMAALMIVLPFSIPINMILCFAGSLFYRLTVERNCAYKFALPAMAGGVTFLIGKGALMSLISGVAFASLATFGLALTAFVPFGIYLAYVILTVNYDVDHKPCLCQMGGA